MKRLIYRLLNSPVLILLTLLGVAIQTSLFSFWYFEYLQPDVVLVAVVWCALRRDFTEGGILTLILGNVAELHSAAPQGLYLIIYMAVYLLVRVAARVLVIHDHASWVMVVLFASVFSKIANMGVLYLMGVPTVPWQHILLLMFPGAVATGLVSHWAFRWLERFDWATFKNIRADQALEDELQLDAPGSRI